MRLAPEQLPDGYTVSQPRGYAAALPLYQRALFAVFPVRGKGGGVPTGATGRSGNVSREDEERWAAQRPQDNVAVRHVGTIAIDVDHHDDKHGADTLAALVRQFGPLPPTWTSTARGEDTPSRQHFFRVPEGVEFGDAGPNVEVCWFGHRYSVVWPSVHPDLGTQYEWFEPNGERADGPPLELNLPALPEAWLEGLRKGRKRAAQRGTELPTGNPMRPTLADLLVNFPARGAGQTNEWLTRVAGHLAAHHRGDRSAYDAALSEAVARVDPAYEDTRKVADSVWAKDQRDHPDEKPAKEQKEQPLAQVLRFLQDEYEFAATAESEVYAVPKNGPRRPLMMTDSGSPTLRARVTNGMFQGTGRAPSPATVDEALRIVWAGAFEGTNRQDLDLRIAQRGDRLVLDLAQPGNARCVVVTGQGWIVQEEPPADVLFRLTRTTKSLPTPTAGGNLDDLSEILGWSTTEPRWTLVRGWLVAACFPDIPRPLLLFTGQPGSGKTTRARLVLSVTDPRDELGSSFGKNEGDEQTMAAGRYLVGFDNITRVSDETSDRLCRFVTGEEAVKRKLYTDADQSVVSFRRTGAITAVTQPSLRADALERLIPVSCDRIDSGERRSETRLRNDFDRDHASILGGLLDALAVTLSNLPGSRDRRADRVRMADFQDVLHAFDPVTAEVYAESTKNVMVEAAESDPFVAAVTEWLGDQQFPLTVVPETARLEAELRLPTNDRGDRPWWPNNPARFSALLQRNTEPLWALGFRVDRVRMSGGLRGLRFSRVGGTVQPALDGADQ